jgi:hypothetical protein
MEKEEIVDYVMAYVSKIRLEHKQLIDRVTKLHVEQTKDGVTFCATCLDPNEYDEFSAWPCPTVKALNGQS